MLDTGAEAESSSDEENENEFESLKEKLKKAGLGNALEVAEKAKEAAGKKVKDEN
jgi:hypothetical protein